MTYLHSSPWRHNGTFFQVVRIDAGGSVLETSTLHSICRAWDLYDRITPALEFEAIALLQYTKPDLKGDPNALPVCHVLDQSGAPDILSIAFWRG